MSINSDYDDFTKRELLEYIAILVERQNRTLASLNTRLNAVEQTCEWVADALVALEGKIDAPSKQHQKQWWEEQSPPQPLTQFPNPWNGTYPPQYPIIICETTNTNTADVKVSYDIPKNSNYNYSYVIDQSYVKLINPEDGDWQDPVPYA